MPAIDHYRFETSHSVIIRGFNFPHDLITDALGLAPTDVAIAGQSNPSLPTRNATTNTWTHKTPELQYATSAINDGRHLEPLESLITKAYERRSQLQRLLNGSEFYFYTVTSSNSPNVIAHLPLRLTRMVVELGADWYCSVWSEPGTTEFLRGS